MDARPQSSSDAWTAPPRIHPSAEIDPRAELAPGVEIGPWCVVRGDVTLEAGVRLLGRVWIEGPARIGAGSLLYPGVSLGFPPQDFKFAPGTPTAGVRIGAGCVLREGATVHAASNDHTPTAIGDRVFMMVGSHAGHDAQVGDGCILVNNAALAGHVRMGAGVNMGGGAVVQQHTRIGRLCMISGGTGLSMDLPPFCVLFDRNRMGGVNLVGMRRSGMARDEITMVRRAFREALRPGHARDEQLAILSRLAESSPAVGEMRDFVAASPRPICPGPMRPPRLVAGWVRAVLSGKADLVDDAEEHGS